MYFFKQQKEYTCACACVRTILANRGIFKSEKELEICLKTNKYCGTTNSNISQYFIGIGAKVSQISGASIVDLKRFHKLGFSIIVNFMFENVGHYAILKSIGSKYIVLKEPYYGKTLKYIFDDFLNTWFDSRKIKRKMVCVKL